LRPKTKLLAAAVALTAGLVVAAQAPTSKQTTAKAAPKAAPKAAAPTNPAPAKSTTAKSTPTKSTPTTARKTTAAKSAPPPVRRYTQQQPTTDRYKEIQQALADRGYFKGPADGQWGPDSADALKQFQREQKIDEDGKINSLSLIALGLGPHRNPPDNQSARSTTASPRTPAPAAETAQAEASAGSTSTATAGP